MIACGRLPAELIIKVSKVSPATQDPWLQTGASIRDNIVFVSDFDYPLYKRVISACALEADFASMPKGDRSKANGLSGGQCQRIALARALYSSADLFVLDDCFSALDATTEAHVWSALFEPGGLLEGKTVLLATSAVYRFKDAHHIVTLADRTVAEQGAYDALLASSGYTSRLVERFGAGKATVPSRTTAESTAPTSSGASLAETREDGEVVRRRRSVV